MLIESLPNDEQNNQTLNAALNLAEQGVPVFPCRPAPDKSPLTGEGGFYNATTDPDQIEAWWTEYPDASFGEPTGERYWVFDIDLKPDKGVDGYLALHDLEREHGKLPDTYTVGTPLGGEHRRYLVPEGVTIPNSRSRIGQGLDVQGTGGYVLIPPSQGYTVVNDAPIAEAPAWLIELITKPQRATEGQHEGKNPSDVTADLSGPPIPFGTRNDTLARLAGKLHDGTRGFDQLLIDLEAINRARCEPPLGEHPTDRPDELARIARSIISRPPCKRAAPSVTPEVLEELGRVEHANLWGRKWKGRRLKVARSVFATLILAAREYGTLIPAGVRVSLSERDLALRAGLSHRSVKSAIGMLRLEETLRKDDYERPLEHSGAFVLVSPDRAIYTHSTTGQPMEGKNPPGESGYTLRAPRLRCSTPGSGKRMRGTVTGTSKVRQGPAPEERDPVIRLDKAAEEVLDWLDATRGALGVKELAEIVGCQARDLRARALCKLEAAGVVRVEEDTVALVEDWLERLDDDRERAGEFEAYERDRTLYQWERDNRWKRTEERHQERLEEMARACGVSEHEIVSRRQEEKPQEQREEAAEAPGVEEPEALVESVEEVRELAREVLGRKGSRLRDPLVRPARARPRNPDLARTVREYLDRNPHRSKEPAGWIATTLWAYDLVEGKPTAQEVAAVLGELERRAA